MKRIVIALAITAIACISFIQDETSSVRQARAEPKSGSDAAAGSPRAHAAVGHPSFLSPYASPIALSGRHVFVVNTPADTVDVIDAGSRAIVARINVGISPVGIAVRPDGREVWIPTPDSLQFDSRFKGGSYVASNGDGDSFTRTQLMALGSDGFFVGTFTPRLKAKVDVDNPHRRRFRSVESAARRLLHRDRQCRRYQIRPRTYRTHTSYDREKASRSRRQD